ncbi:MAG: hypothetical protein DRH37_05210, partial [Deltaproteobacteria bacterium]
CRIWVEYFEDYNLSLTCRMPACPVRTADRQSTGRHRVGAKMVAYQGSPSEAGERFSADLYSDQASGGIH